MAVGDVYEVVDRQVLNGQVVLNVFYYKVQSESVSDNDAQSVATAFHTTVLPKIKAFQTNDITHTGIEVTNLYDESDGYTMAISETGGSAGTFNTMGTFESIGYRLTGDNHAVKSGAKRFAGVDAQYVSDGTVVGAGLVTLLNTLAAQLFADLPWGLLAAEVLIPVVVKRILEGDRYRLPANAAEGVTSHVTGATWSPTVTSQVSRKIGRGE